MNKIPDNQKISFVPHLLNHLDFAAQPPLILRQRIAQRAGLRQPFQMRHPGCKSFAHHFLKIAAGRVPFRHLEFRKRIRNAVDLNIASRCDVHGPRQRVWNLSEYSKHLLRSLEVELVRRELHPALVAHGLAGLNAKQHFLRVRVFMMQIMTVVCGHQRNSSLFRKPHELGIYALLDLQSLVLNL